jgi:hypothetical protein
MGHRSLNLEGNELGGVGITALSRGIGHNTGLTSLNLAMNTLGASIEAVDALAVALQANPSLIKINLDGNLIGDECLARLITPLMANNRRILELAVTPFVDNTLYRQLIEWLDANKPKPVKKRPVCCMFMISLLILPTHNIMMNAYK